MNTLSNHKESRPPPEGLLGGCKTASARPAVLLRGDKTGSARPAVLLRGYMMLAERRADENINNNQLKKSELWQTKT